MTGRKIGVVVKLIDPKTIKVEVLRTLSHPLYGKRYTRTSSFLVDSSALNPAVGQRVEIASIPRLSKNKAWKAVKILGSLPAESNK